MPQTHSPHHRARGDDGRETPLEDGIEAEGGVPSPPEQQQPALSQPVNEAASGMPVGADTEKQQEAQHDIDRHAGKSEQHRRRGVLAGEKARMEHLDQHVGRKTDGVGGQHLGGRRGVGGVEGAVLEQHAHDRAGGDQERGRRRQR